jgi:hypothetical protein
MGKNFAVVDIFFNIHWQQDKDKQKQKCYIETKTISNTDPQETGNEAMSPRRVSSPYFLYDTNQVIHIVKTIEERTNGSEITLY